MAEKGYYENLLFEYLKDTINDSEKVDLNVDEFPEEYRKLAAGVKQIMQWVWEVRHFLDNIANGDLAVIPPGKENPFASELKQIQSDLLHLTWQVDQITKGDYSQRVDFLGMFSDAFNSMTEQLKDRTEKLGYVDALTHTYNRRFCMETANRLFDSHAVFSLAFADIDYLKFCNDKYGHEAGDKYICAVATALERIPGKKYVCRMDGDEFVVLFENMTEEEAWQGLLQTRAELKERSIGDNGEIPQSFSFGVVDVKDSQCKSINDMLDLADRKMYEYKVNEKKISRKVYQSHIADADRFYSNLPISVLHIQMDVRNSEVDLDSVRTVNFNAATSKLFGYSGEELSVKYMKNAYACIIDEDAKKCKEALAEALKEGKIKDFCYPKIRFQRKDGSRGVLQVNVAMADVQSVTDVYFTMKELFENESNITGETMVSQK